MGFLRGNFGINAGQVALLLIGCHGIAKNAGGGQPGPVQGGQPGAPNGAGGPFPQGGLGNGIQNPWGGGQGAPDGLIPQGGLGNGVQDPLGEPPSLFGPKSLTEGDVNDIQAVADEFNVNIDVGGSRAQGAGRNINDWDLPVDKGNGTRSDIDFIFDDEHKDAKEIMDRLREVGGGAGSKHPDNKFLSAFPNAPEEKGLWRFRFTLNQPPKVIPNGQR